MAVVSDPVWEEEGSVLWHDCELLSVPLQQSIQFGCLKTHTNPPVFLQWAVPFMILIVSIKSKLIISYLVSVAAGVSVAAAFLLPW